MNRTNYISNYQKEHYDRFNLMLPKGTKEKIKVVTKQMNISINEYILMLITEDNASGKSKLAEKKNGFDDSQKDLLKKLQVPKKYYEMIEDLSFDNQEGYYIHLKQGYVNDYTKSRNIICMTCKDVRRIIVKSHKIREEGIVDGIDFATLEQLKKWQIPQKYYEMIESIEEHTIILKNGYINDYCGSNIITVNKANEFRSIMKYTHKKDT